MQSRENVNSQNISDQRSLKEYQDRVRAICDRDRENSDQFKKQNTEVGHQYEAGNMSASDLVNAYLQQADQLQNVETGLQLDLKALNPPRDLESTQNDAVTAWSRLLAIGVERMEAVRQAPTTEEQLSSTSTKGAEGDALATQINGDLRRLAGSGCSPAF
jgi:hypothetical protein